MDLDEHLASLSPAKRELLERWLAEEPAAAGYIPARTETEHTLAAIWQQELAAERVGIDDDYFELGGDSIHAIVIVSRAQEAGIALEAADLLELRTIRAIAGRAAPRPPVAGGGLPPGPVAEPSASYPLTPLQEGMLYHTVGGSTPGAYLVQVRCRLSGALDTSALAAAWQAVFAANDALRSVVRWTDGERPSQLFLPALQMPVTVADHTGLPPGEQAAAFAALAEGDRLEGFDLETGPLMRLTLVREGEAAFRCLWTYHHLILDGWAQQLILRDVFDCYERLRGGLAGVPRSRPSFVSYLSWLAGQPELDEQFWRHSLASLARPTKVAGPGCAEGRVVTAERPMTELKLPGELAASLPRFARNNGLTLGTLVHASWALLLCIHCGQQDALFGSTLSGRPPELPGATETIGMFAVTLPLRVRCPGGEAVLDWLRGVQRRLAGLHRQQYVALSKIERLAGLGHGSGLFDSIVVVENFPAWDGLRDEVAGTRIDEIAVVVEEGYPLVLEFAPGPPAALRARYDDGRIAGDTAAGVLAALVSCLARIASDDGTTPLEALREQVSADWQRHAEELRRERAGTARQRLAGARRRPAAGTGPEVRA